MLDIAIKLPTTDTMDMSGFTLDTVYIARWRTGLFGSELLGVFKKERHALAALRERSLNGPGCAKSEPREQNLEFNLATVRALVLKDGDQFIPFGAWMDGVVSDILFQMHHESDSDDKNGMEYSFTFGAVKPGVQIGAPADTL